jgi:hypothetical protein
MLVPFLSIGDITASDATCAGLFSASALSDSIPMKLPKIPRWFTVYNMQNLEPTLTASVTSARAAQKAQVHRLIIELSKWFGRPEIDPKTLDLILKRLHEEHER